MDIQFDSWSVLQYQLVLKVLIYMQTSGLGSSGTDDAGIDENLESDMLSAATAGKLRRTQRGKSWVAVQLAW